MPLALAQRVPESAALAPPGNVPRRSRDSARHPTPDHANDPLLAALSPPQREAVPVTTEGRC